MGKPVKNPLNNVPAGKNGRQKYPTVPTAPKKGRQLYVKEKSYLANKKKYDTALPGKLSIVRSDGARVERDVYNHLSEVEAQYIKQYVKTAPVRAKALTALIIVLTLAVSGLMMYIFRDALFGKDGIIGGLFYPDYTFDLAVNDAQMGSATVDAQDPDEGTVMNLSAKPNYGYVFCGWYENGEFISAESDFTYIMPAKNVEMMAVFAKDKFDVKVLSMNPAFTAGIDAEYDYLTEITVTANDIAGTDFIAWVVDGAEYSTEKTITFTVDKDFTVYAEYYAYGATEIYTWPTAGPAPLGTALGDIELVGGSANVLGSFEWANPDERIYEGGEYIVRFVPLVTGYPENHALIGVEIAENVLTAPTLKVEGGVAKWNDIDGDSGYVLDINGEEIDLSESDLSYKLPAKMDEYFVSVYAKGDGESVADSEWSNIERYVPDKPDIDELDFGKAKSEYNEDGEMVKFGGTIDVNRDNFDEVFGDHVVWEPDGFSFEIELDIGKYLSEKTKREILNLNKFNINTDVSIVLYAQVKVIDPKVYAEVDLDFPLTMENLAFGVSYTSMVTTILNISINGEFVEPELRRSTLHLMSMEVIGLEEPIYKFKEYVFQLKNTPIQVEFALCFDAVGAIAALAKIQNVQTTDYYAGIHAIENGEAIFVPYFGRDVQSNITTIELDGGFDVNLNCVRLSATLQLTDGKEAVSLLRLNLDAFNVETDLSGNVNVELDHTDSIIPDATVETDIDGSYYFYGQVTFEYYVYLKIHFKFLPLGDFEVKLLDGSHILAEWEYVKGGLPKTPYMDEAVHSTTPIYATDGEFEYFIDLEGDLIRVNVGSDYLLQPLYADLDSERIVDIDDHYIYVLSGDKLRRVGRDAPTERTILVGIDKVIYTDRSYIYYTTKEDPNKIDKIYRSDVSNDEPLLITLPKGYSAINMRYDYLEEYYIIYAESDKHGACYFTYDGYSLIRHGVNEHKYWSNTVFASGDIAYYSLDKDGNIVECFIRSDEHGITHADGMKSVGISDLGIFTVIERAGDVYGYELGLYPLDKSSGAYLKIAEVCDPDVANRIVCYDGEAYFIDFDGENIVISKTDGKNVRTVAISELEVSDPSSVRAEIHGETLFVYKLSASEADVIYSIDIHTLETAPYIAGDNTAAFDRGAPEDVLYTLGGNVGILGVYINKYSDAQLDKLSSEVEKNIDRYNKLNSFLEKNFDFYKGAEISSEQVLNYLNEYGDIFFRIDAEVERFEADGNYLGNLKLTLPADSFTGYSYGVHTGSIVTTHGIFTVKLNVVDSRMPSYEQNIIPSYDKGNPVRVRYDITLYDSTYTLVGVPEDAYDVIVDDISYAFIFYPHYLSELPYGEQAITLVSEGESFEFKLNVEDSRTPKDSTYLKYFDLTYPKNVVFDFDLYDEKYVTAVSGNGIPAMGAYSVSESGEAVTLYGRYLNTLTPGDYVFEFTTAEKTFEVTVRVIRTMLPEADAEAAFDGGSGDDLLIGFERNDASFFDVYINGSIVPEEYWRYSLVSGAITIDRAYIMSHLDYGIFTVSVRSVIYSGDDIKTHINNTVVTFTDSRAPVLDSNEIIYVIPSSGSHSLNIGATVYDNRVVSVVAEDGTVLDFDIIEGTIERRNVVIRIVSAEIVDILGEGEHTLTVTIGDETLTLALTVRDDRLPRVIGNDYVNYNIDYPTPVSFIFRLYGERFVSISYNGTVLDDAAYSFVLHSDNALYHILTINREYLETLGLAYSQVAVFTVKTNVNEVNVALRCEMDPTNPTPPEPQPTPDRVETTPIEIATSITLTPGSASVDKADVQPVSFKPSYGSNNAFGSLIYGLHTLRYDVDYSIGNDGTITLSASFLKTLSDYGSYTITLRGAKGRYAYFTVNVFDSRSPYVDGTPEFSYDRYENNTASFNAVIYDSKATYLRVGETYYTSGISSNASGKITMNNALLDSIALGTHEAFVGFNDTASEIRIILNVSDTGLYVNDARVDKALFENDDVTFTLPWTLYQGEVTECTSDSLNVVSFTSESVVLSGFASASYGGHTVTATANGRTIDIDVTVYDSRRPVTKDSVYKFNKGNYPYTLNPNDAKEYDLRIELELYDNTISGIDMLSKQTIRGNNIEYSDYEREGNDYLINYLYLYRLPVGTYTYYISTTDGDATVTVEVSDSRAPKLIDANPVIYDYAAETDKVIRADIFDDDISSLSYIDIVTGNRITLTRGVHYDVTLGDTEDTITIYESLLKNGFYDSYTYQFTLATNTERTLEFGVKIENGPRRPFNITYYSVPWKDGEPEYYIESIVLYEGDMIPVPETPSFNYYKFLGFYTERTGGAKFDFSKPVSSDCDIFLHWQPESYKLTLMSNGSAISTMNVQYLSEIPAVADPTWAGYTFIKWTLDEAGEIRYNPAGEIMPHRDITLYAQWQINEYTVVFKDKNGVVLKEETLLAYEDATAPDDALMQIEHYNFKGWDKVYTNVLSDLVVSAVYEAVKYDINYNLNEGALPSGAPLTYTIEGGVKLPTPIRTGYDFLGWYMDEALTVGPVTDIPYGTLPGFTVYASFRLATYTVTLNSTVNGVTYDIIGAPANNALRITYEDEYSIPRVRVGEGYFFLGWYSKPNGAGTKFTDYLGNGLTQWSHAGDITLYAHVVSLLDFTSVNVANGTVDFNISKYSAADLTVTGIELLYNGMLVDSISAEDLALGAFSFSELLYETAYEIKVSYTYTLPDVDGVRASSTSVKVRIIDDTYPETIIGNTVAEIRVGNEVFDTMSISSVTVMCEGAEASGVKVFLPGNGGSFLTSAEYWLYLLDLENLKEYEVTINYTYTLKYYDGTYTSSITVPFTTGTMIMGVHTPVASISTYRVDDYKSGFDYYYSYAATISFNNIFIENSVKLIKWELYHGSAETGTKKAESILNKTMSGNTASFGTGKMVGSGSLVEGNNYTVVFTYEYNLQNGQGVVTQQVARTFSAVNLHYYDCFVAGTKVTMADGSLVNIEDVKLGDMVLVWNFYTGRYEAAPVILIHAPYSNEIFYLNFENGARVGIGYSHGFFVDGRFVDVKIDNALDFVGRDFLVDNEGALEYTKLVSVEFSSEAQPVYGLITEGHYNHLADGFLTVVSPFMIFVNIFDYDGLMYDPDAVAADLEKYGYLDYNVFADYVSEELFNSLNGKYLSVVIGKGNATVDQYIWLTEYLKDDSVIFRP